MSIRKKGIGVVGCSNRIKVLLVELLKNNKNIEIRGLCDPDVKRVAEFKEELAPHANIYASDKAMADAGQIDWIIVGSWNSCHAEQVITAFEAGKNVFCEKPLATSFEDCLAIQKSFRKIGKKLMIGFTLRYTWQNRKLKEIIDHGTIGRIVSFEFNETLSFNHGGHIMCCWRRKREFTGCHILEKCSHDIDIANWLVGSRVKKVASFGGLNFFNPENETRMTELQPNEAGHNAYCSWPTAQGNNPFTSDKDIIDNQVCIMEYENGVRATFHTNLNAGIPERRMYILGTEGAIRADLNTGNIEVCKIGFDEKPVKHQGEHIGGHGGGDKILVASLSDMICKDAPSLTSLETGIESAVVCLAMDEAMLENKVVDLSDKWRELSAGFF